MARRWQMLAALAAMMLIAGPARAQVQKAEILQAVQAAFSTWEQVECSGLTFEYKGELDPFVPEKEGAIVVYFGNDNLTWTHGQDAYYTTSTIGMIEDGNITKASIGMNARDIKWSFGAESNHIDIQTAVLHLIPAAIGFYVGSHPTTGSLLDFINYNNVDHALKPEHIAGAQFTYFAAGTGCTQTAEPPVCGESVPAPDAGASEAGADDAGSGDTPIQLCIFHSNPNDKPSGEPYSWLAQPIPYYVYIPASGWLPGSSGQVTSDGGVVLDTGATPIGDGGVSTTDASVPQTCTTSDQCGDGKVCTSEGLCVAVGGDDGCCRISHTREENIAYSFLLLMGLGLFIWRRRRRSE